ncbi:MAG TPA: DUF423 domain-containing protein [Cyclobacteriaceae bacterium]|nr:DUF423 domain-containing protein [Cyclobacteriaceae bacterium]
MIHSRQTLLIASFSGVLAVSLGAFGAHALKALLIENGRLDTYELAVRYHFYHTLALLAIGLLMERYNPKTLSLSALFMIIGLLLFSGSLYVLAILNTTSVALITPIGGVFLIGGWALLFYAVLKRPN